MKKTYAEYSLEEQLSVFKEYLPRLPQILEQLEKFNERDEKLEIEHKVDVDLTDVKGSVAVTNPIEVNDLPEMLEGIKKLADLIEKQDLKPQVNVTQEKTTIDLKPVEKLLKNLIKKDVVVNVEKDQISFPSTAREALPVRLSNGKSFYEAMFTGGGGGIGKLANIDIVESSDNPGVFGMVVLNPDGSTISAGAGGGGGGDVGTFAGVDGNILDFVDGNDMSFVA